MPVVKPLAGLYAITNEKLLTSERFAIAVEQALLGGARIIQYRDKSDDAARRLQQARVIRRLCCEYDALMIINDDIALAGHSNADGVHLGRDDGSIANARLVLGDDSIIGVSCYDDFGRAQRAADEGADYVAFGAFYRSPTKPEAATAELSLLQRAAGLDTAVCAIGGIDCTNARPLIEAGADMVAVISDVFGAQDIREAAHCLQQLFHCPPEHGDGQHQIG